MFFYFNSGLLYSPLKVEPLISKILGWKMVLPFPDFTAKCPFSDGKNSKPVPLAFLFAFSPEQFHFQTKAVAEIEPRAATVFSPKPKGFALSPWPGGGSHTLEFSGFWAPAGTKQLPATSVL